MVLKPISLSSLANFVPPVTGVNGSLAPVANNYDTSGNFQGRGRSGSVKRKRTENEMDAVFDLGHDYPPLSGPPKPKLDLSVVKDLVVAAGVAGGEIRSMLEDQNIDEKTKAMGGLGLALLAAVEALLESGLVPLSGNAREAPARTAKPPPPPAAVKPTPPPGAKELSEGIEKADREAIMFNADLGPVTMANRNGLVNALCVGIRKSVQEKCAREGSDLGEAIRDMDDALSCVGDMEFIGEKSKKFVREGDDRSNKFCTMPVKFKFADRNARINFEKTLRSHTDLKASISLPKPIRIELNAFQRALKARYPEEIVVARLDPVRARFYALRKVDKAEGWTSCSETMALAPGVLLSGYNPRTTVILPAMAQPQEGTAGTPILVQELVLDQNMDVTIKQS
jgi:hypothetical protein